MGTGWTSFPQISGEHADKLTGATVEELAEAIQIGIVMGGSPAIAATHIAFHALDKIYSQEILKL